MNKVIIAGHPSAGCGELESLLFRHGMSQAQPSRREGLLPTEITAAMVHANRGPGAVEVSLKEFEPVKPGPVWKELLLDLLLGNSDQKWWGWADPGCLPLVDFWCEMDPQAAFVLVYDEPHRVFEEPATWEQGAGADALLSRRLDHWAACNRALLGFFLRHPGRSLLVNARQVLSTEDLFVSQVRARLGLSLGPSRQPDPNDRSAGMQDPLHPGTGENSGPLARACESLFRLTGQPAGNVIQSLHAEAAERLIIAQYLAEHPEYVETYQELQAVSNMPCEAGLPTLVASGPAWQALADLRQTLISVLGHAVNSYLALGGRQQATLRENELLQSQMQRIQKELESQYLQLQSLRGPKVGAKGSGKQPDRPTGAAKRVRQQLSYRLGSIMVSRSRSPIGLLGMPFAMLGEARRFKRERQKACGEKLPPLREYSDWNEAQRIQRQLSYRLGKTLMDKGRSPVGWISLPFALVREVRNFKRECGFATLQQPPV